MRTTWASGYTTHCGAGTRCVREGELFDVGGGDLRVIDRLSFSSGSGFNDARQVAFQASFTDGSNGVFVTLVPEPGCGAVVAAAVACTALLQRAEIAIGAFCGPRMTLPGRAVCKAPLRNVTWPLLIVTT